MNKTLVCLWIDEDVCIDIQDLRALKAISFYTISKAVITNNFLLNIYNQFYKKEFDIIDYIKFLADTHNYHELQLLTEECRQEKSLSPFR